MLTFLKSKLHHVTITQADLHYEGSLTIDKDLMRAANIQPYEQIHVLNMSNGERIVTYAIEGEAGSGIICLNGPSARLGQVGDKAIVLTYQNVYNHNSAIYKPIIVLVDENNKIEELRMG